MHIMLLDSGFHGAYDSFSCFLDEIRSSLCSMGHHVYLAKTTDDAINYYDDAPIDFSIGLGKYPFFHTNEALCDIYKCLHYQWIIDNPLKVQGQFDISYMIPIFIDYEFSFVWRSNGHKPLWLPLGIPDIDYPILSEHTKKRKMGIVFAGQIKDLQSLCNEIDQSICRKAIYKFLNKYRKNMDASYIRELLGAWTSVPRSQRHSFFRLTNSYLRSYKRHYVLQRIKNVPIVLAGEVSDELSTQANIIRMGKLEYRQILSLFSEYMYVLNISPNYSHCIHDRISRALWNGATIITDTSPEDLKPLKYSCVFFKYADLYRKFDFLEERINWKNQASKCNCNPINDYLNSITWKSLLGRIIIDFRKRCIR